MRIHFRRCRKLFHWQSGQAMPEYAVIAGAILVAAYLIFQTVGNEVNALMTSILVAF